MNISSLEITEREYCIKLSRDVFDLSLVQQLIKRIQAENLFSKTIFAEEEDDIISRRNVREESRGFDYLEDK